MLDFYTSLEVNSNVHESLAIILQNPNINPQIHEKNLKNTFQVMKKNISQKPKK